MLHLYFGVFITPALIFFAFTGFVQTFSWHETTRGSSYKPPAILAKLGQLHKKQTLVLPNRRPSPPPDAPASPNTQQPGTPGNRRDDASRPAANVPQQDSSPRRPDDGRPAPGKKQNLLPMKLFFGLVSIGLFISCITGLYMSYKFIRNKPLITATLVAGIVIPVLLTFL